MGRGCPPPQPTRDLGERRKLPQRVFVHSELERTHVVTTNLVFFGGGVWGGGAARLLLSVSLQAPPQRPHEPVVGLLEGGI